MNVWRIGSYWGQEDIAPVFKEHRIAFAGPAVEDQVSKVSVGDLVAITAGQQIIGVSKAAQLLRLKDINPDFATSYDDVYAIRLSNLFFSENYPDVNFGIYDGQGKQFHQAHGAYVKQIAKLFNQLMSMNFLEKSKQVLLQKHQIILQGPPGTGKTRLAKQIARDMTRPVSITNDDIIRNINVGKELITTSETAAFTITKIHEDRLDYVRKSTGNNGQLTFKDIIAAYTEKIWLIPKGIVGGSDTYSATIAKHVYDNYESEQFKIIQFHPAYSYEDFVRGIVVESKGESLEYKSQNKLLAKFAKKANTNYDDSRKTPTVYSKEKWIENQFSLFVEQIEENLETEEKIELTEKVSIFDIDVDAFRYKGKEGWVKNGNRMLFSDIKSAYFDENKTRQDIKKNTNLSGLAHHHASYYVRVLYLFKEFLKEKKLVYTETQGPNETLKAFVLIVDEINRANLPVVLGELIYALEYRGEKVDSMYATDEDGNTIIIPPNLYIIGTMNTADRSAGHIDYAIRRRFAFVDVLPELEPVHPLVQDIFKKVSELFIESFDKYNPNEPLTPAKETLAPDFRPEDVWIGHSYFICKKEDGKEDEVNDKAKVILSNKMKYEVLPILKEYVKDGILNDNDKTKVIIQSVAAWQ